MDLQHPEITQINRSGYPKELSGIENVVGQPEYAGIDFFGTEILEGDEIAIDHNNFDEIILKDDLKGYCAQQLNFVFHNEVVLDRNRWVSFKESNLEKYLHDEYNFEFLVAD